MFTVICNPAAGTKRSQRILPLVFNELKQRGIEYRLLQTAYPPDPKHYADVPCKKGDTVCVVGGDGTVLDVLNQLPEREMRLITVPCGTGNDFIKCAGLPKDPVKALRAQLNGKIRSLDYAYASNEVFLNVFGLGFDVEVLKKLIQFKRKHSGLKAYLMALVKAVHEYKPTSCEISIDGGEFKPCLVSILSIGNGQYIGGGMKAVPPANAFDGWLDVVEVRPVKKWLLLILLPLFIFGLHVKAGVGKTYRCKHAVLRGKKLSYEIDGEIRSADQIELKIVSGKLTFSC